MIGRIYVYQKCPVCKGKFVEDTKGKTLVEGAVDEIYEAGSDAVKNEPTDPFQAKGFVDETGVYLIVVNVGTEHRATQQDYKAVYLGDRAREISSLVGRRLVENCEPTNSTALPRMKFDVTRQSIRLFGRASRYEMTCTQGFLFRKERY